MSSNLNSLSFDELKVIFQKKYDLSSYYCQLVSLLLNSLAHNNLKIDETLLDNFKAMVKQSVDYLDPKVKLQKKLIDLLKKHEISIDDSTLLVFNLAIKLGLLQGVALTAGNVFTHRQVSLSFDKDISSKVSPKGLIFVERFLKAFSSKKFTEAQKDHIYSEILVNEL